MILNDKQYGKPFIDYTDVKATLAALTPAAGSVVYATDTLEYGIYTGSAWFWLPTGVTLTETVQDIVGAFVVAGTGMTITYDDAANTLTFATSTVTTVTLAQLHEHVYQEDHTAETNGAKTNFICANEFEPYTTEVYKAGALLQPGVDYTEDTSADALTLTVAPATSAVLIFAYITA